MAVSACVAGGALTSLCWMSSVLSLLSPDFRGVLEDAFFYCAVREYVMNDIIQGPYQELVAAKLAMALGVMGGHGMSATAGRVPRSGQRNASQASRSISYCACHNVRAR